MRSTGSGAGRSGLFVAGAMLALGLCIGPVRAAGQDVLQQGLEAYRGGDYARAAPLIRRAAEAGDPEGQFALGTLYFKGQGMARDPVESFRWYSEAARQGHRSAQFNLGNAYVYGRGVDVDAFEAVRWWRRAAFQNLPNAQFNLGVYYLGTSDSAAGASLGRAWLRRAAENGWSEALDRLAALGEDPMLGAARDWEREPLPSEARLLTLDPDAFTLQLFAGGTLESARRFVEAGDLGPQAGVFRLPRDGKLFWNVVYGVYGSLDAAEAAVSSMRPGLKRLQPWPRRVDEVRDAVLQVWASREDMRLP